MDVGKNESKMRTQGVDKMETAKKNLSITEMEGKTGNLKRGELGEG